MFIPHTTHVILNSPMAGSVIHNHLVSSLITKMMCYLIRVRALCRCLPFSLLQPHGVSLPRCDYLLPLLAQSGSQRNLLESRWMSYELPGDYPKFGRYTIVNTYSIVYICVKYAYMKIGLDLCPCTGYYILPNLSKFHPQNLIILGCKITSWYCTQITSSDHWEVKSLLCIKGINSAMCTLQLLVPSSGCSRMLRTQGNLSWLSKLWKNVHNSLLVICELGLRILLRLLWLWRMVLQLGWLFLLLVLGRWSSLLQL